MSRLGKKPITVPQGVKIELKEKAIHVEGPKGKLNYLISSRITVENKDGQILLKRVADTKLDRSLHGLSRALILNMINGVTTGYIKELEIVGVGFRAQAQGNNLSMQLGFSHPVVYPIPAGIKIETPKPTQIIVTGIDKEKVGKVASEIRKTCPPEPYKGTGIRYKGERVRKKVGKAQATK